MLLLIHHHTSDAIVCALFALQLTVRWKTTQPLNLGNQSSAKKRPWYFCYNWIYRNPQLPQVVVTALHNIPARLIGKLGSLMVMLFFSCSRHFRLCTPSTLKGRKAGQDYPQEDYRKQIHVIIIIFNYNSHFYGILGSLYCLIEKNPFLLAGVDPADSPRITIFPILLVCNKFRSSIISFY